MSNIYILDRYTNKYIQVKEVPDDQKDNMKAGDKIVYEGEENGRKKLSVGIFIGFPTKTDRDGFFLRILEGEEKKYFEEQQKEAQNHFPMFKKEFRERFEGSMPVTARYQIFSRQIYFYFYSEQRYQFGDFVRNFQQKVGAGIFFFQIGSRDIIRLSHQAERMLDMDGRLPRARSLRPRPSVSIDDILIQGLEGRDIEKLKDHSGKFKPSLAFEVETYKQELEKYPTKGQKIQVKSQDTKGIVTGMNINTGEIMIRTEDKTTIRVNLEDTKWSIEEKKKIEKQRDRDHRSTNK